MIRVVSDIKQLCQPPKKRGLAGFVFFGRRTAQFVFAGLALESRAGGSGGTIATIDHSDMHGPEPQCHDPSGASSDKGRGLSPEAVPHKS